LNDFEFDDEPQSVGATPWLNGLNPEQLQAVQATEGPVLVLSGAGTGKTRVLTTRLAHILLTAKAKPWNILAVTFTNKAAREMRDRVSALVGGAAEQIWLGTFHALGARLLRRHAPLVGLESNFTILDTDDQLRLLKQVMEGMGIDAKRWTPQSVMGMIQRWKDRGLNPDQVSDAGELAGGRGIALYRAYQERLATLNACDFGDLLLHCLTFMQKPQHQDLLAELQSQFRYIMVDEYQDTNVAQYLWLRLLAQKHRNICCVGDDDQSVYSWRGAEVENILRFERDFPGARIIRLEANYRSTPTILAAASGLIAHNAGRLGKTLRPGRADAEAGAKITVRGLWDGEDEARFVVEEIEALQRAGGALAEMAILVRAGFQTREFEERLVSTGVPYKVVGGLRFYERQEIRDALAYLRVVMQPADDLAFERIFNLPKRGLGEQTLQTTHLLARHQAVPLLEAARRLALTDELGPKARTTMGKLVADFERWRSLVPHMDHAELAATILDESGYTEMWQKEKSPDAQGRLENLKELVAALEEFDSLADFLEHVSLVMENDDKLEADRVVIMTLHGAKGLEFDHVFLPGWEEGVFPHARAIAENGAKGLEEERRLAYVGLTRARKRVFVSYAANRRVYNQWQTSLPSRFTAELPEATVDRLAERGLFGGVTEQANAWSQDWQSVARVAKHRESPTIAAPSGSFAVGVRVFHQKFGYGRVTAIEGNKLDVAFEKAGDKKVIDSFVTEV
jgi:DNA helicase-2/ATP-dependent DNA helicase PcrA